MNFASRYLQITTLLYLTLQTYFYESLKAMETYSSFENARKLHGYKWSVSNSRLIPKNVVTFRDLCALEYQQ